MSLTADIDRAIDSLMKTFEFAQLYGTEDIKNPDVYLRMAEELISIKEIEKNCNEALEEAKNASNLPDFEKTYELALESRNRKSNIKDSSEYKSFAKTLQSKISDEEEQLILNAEINVYDPITRKRMQNPVKNTICGHHYEQKTILETIKDNFNYRCPIPGCVNKKFIAKEHLQIDDEFRKQILAAAQEEEEEDDDDDD